MCLLVIRILVINKTRLFFCLLQAEEKQAHEIRKLKRELDNAHEKVATLTSQLTTNVSTIWTLFYSFSSPAYNRVQLIIAVKANSKATGNAVPKRFLGMFSWLQTNIFEFWMSRNCPFHFLVGVFDILF